MNLNRIEGKLRQVGGKVKARWGELTDDEYYVIVGRAQQLGGEMQERYGMELDGADQRDSQSTKKTDSWFSAIRQRS